MENKKVLRVGLDYHGVITRHSGFFTRLSKALLDAGHHVYILTGQTQKEAEELVTQHGVKFNHFYSIVDFHYNAGTEMTRKNGYWYLPDEVWDSSKGKYAMRQGLDIHFDDCEQYFKYFPKSCHCILVDDNFENMIKMIETMIPLSEGSVL